MTSHLDLTPDPRILEVLGDIPFQPWQCMAELVDNSFDAFQSQIDGRRTPSSPQCGWKRQKVLMRMIRLIRAGCGQRPGHGRRFT